MTLVLLQVLSLRTKPCADFCVKKNTICFKIHNALWVESGFEDSTIWPERAPLASQVSTEIAAVSSAEIAALTKGLAALDKQVEEAMVNRKEENEDYQSLMANNGAALEIIGMAKNRLNKFYHPAMYVAPASFI